MDRETTDPLRSFDPAYAKDMEEMRVEQEENMEDTQEENQMDSMLLNQEMNEGYGAPEPEEKQNAHSFLHKAAFNPDIDTVKTTFLTESELGRPLFSVRFMLKMEDVAKYYLDPLIKKMGGNAYLDNGIAKYFNADIKNISDSGMSNKGFSMNLNVTRRMDQSKTRVRTIPDLKGGNLKNAT